MGIFGVVNSTFKLLARFEVRHILTRLTDADLSGLRIAYRSGLAVVIRKGAETTNFNALALCKGFRHDVKDRLHCQVDVAAGQLIQLVAHSLDEF